MALPEPEAIAVTLAPYSVVVPYSNQAVAGSAPGLTAPLSLAAASVIASADPVVATGPAPVCAKTPPSGEPVADTGTAATTTTSAEASAVSGRFTGTS